MILCWKRKLRKNLLDQKIMQELEGAGITRKQIVTSMIRSLSWWRSSTVRRNVIQNIGYLKNKEAVDTLIKLISNRFNLLSNEFLVEAAIDALGEIKDEKAVPILLMLLKEEKRNFHAACAYISIMGFPEAIPDNIELLAYLLSARQYIADEIEKRILQIGFQAVPTLLRFIHSEQNARIIRILGIIKDKRAVQPLLEFVKDNYKWVARYYYGRDQYFAGIKALGELGDSTATKFLLDMFLKSKKDMWSILGDADRQVRMKGELLVHVRIITYVIEAIGNIADKQATDILCDFLKEIAEAVYENLQIKGKWWYKREGSLSEEEFDLFSELVESTTVSIRKIGNKQSVLVLKTILSATPRSLSKTTDDGFGYQVNTVIIDNPMYKSIENSIRALGG